MIRERPILFSGPMVMAILAGRKTQTRRVIKPQPERDGKCGPLLSCGDPAWRWKEQEARGLFKIRKVPEAMLRSLLETFHCPYGFAHLGARLWVRETWQLRDDTAYYTKADTKLHLHPNCAEAYAKQYGNRQHEFGWRPAIHMPRWASRITLEITGVRVERLQEISEEDARAEGLTSSESGPCDERFRTDYRELWNSLNAKRGFGWEENPFVWVITFERIKA